MATIRPGLRAFIYARVSKDEHKRRKSVSQQIDEGKHAAADFEVASLKIYDKDNNKSASAFGKKVREDWARMMDDLGDGQADLVIFWEISRGSRTAKEGVAFVDICAEKSVLVHVIDEDGTYDARKPRDRKRLLEMFTDAEYESGQTSLRIKRDKVALRAKGWPDGKIPFGHQRLYDERTRELIRQEPHPTNRACIREAVARVRKGHSLRKIIQDFNKRNEHDRDCPRWVPTPTDGYRWQHSNIRSVLMNPAHIGMRRDPEWKPGSAATEFIPAAWEPLFDDPEWISEWWACYRILSDGSRRVHRNSQATHLLSYFMTCYECSRRVKVTLGPNHSAKRSPRYGCSEDTSVWPLPEKGPGCASIVAGPADKFITDLVLTKLSDPKVITAAGDDGDADAVAARAKAANLRAKLDEFWESAMRTDGSGITLAQYEQARNSIEPQIQEAEAAAQSAAAPPLLREFLSMTAGAGEEVLREVWEEDLSISTRRKIVQLLFESIRLKKGRPGRVPFDPDRIVYTWRKW